MPEDILEFATSMNLYSDSNSSLSQPQWMPTASTCANHLYRTVPPDAVTSFLSKEKVMALIDNVFSSMLFGINWTVKVETLCSLFRIAALAGYLHK